MKRSGVGIEASSEDQRYRILVDSITDYAIFLLDRNGLVASWNPGAQRFKGFEASEILGQHFSRFYTEEDRRQGAPENTLLTATREGRFEKEGWRVRKNGERFWAHIVVDAIKDESGQVIGFAKVTRDLTERTHALEVLRKSEEQFRVLVQGVTDYAIYMLDETGKVSSWNAGAQRIKGYTPEEIIGEHFSRFYTEEDRETGVPQQSLDTAIRDGRFEKEGWRVRKDGTRFVAHVVIDPIRNDAGILIGFAKITRDITEKRQAQQALERAQHALLQTQKLESIGQLTGGIAHDFNNLLTAMINSLELLRKRVSSDRQSLALVQNALDGAERGSTLTKRMLAFARRQELKLSSVDIAPLVSGMMGLLRRSIGPAVKIAANFPSDLPPVRSDANQMEAALLNLTVNARDAMPDGGTITISARDASFGEDNGMGLAPGRYACLTVVDTGRGMDQETLAHATEPFFTTKGVGKGTGLGLSMVHGFAQQSGGTLRIMSKLGSGTTAEVWLPASASFKVSASDKPEREEATEPVTSEQLTILVVDDDELVLASTTATLEDFGHKIIEATNGMQALEIVAADRSINLVVTDQAMPGMAGLELVRAIKHLRPELPIILASGYSDVLGAIPADIRKLTKPYRRADLAEAIASAMQR